MTDLRSHLKALGDDLYVPEAPSRAQLDRRARRRRQRHIGSVAGGLGVVAVVVGLLVSSFPQSRPGVVLSARDIALVAGKKAFATSGGPPVGAMGTGEGGSLWALDGDGLFVSDDSGSNWTKTTPPSAGDPLADLLSVDFLDPQHGWVVATTEQDVQVDRTVNGGSAWQVASLPTSLFPRGWDGADISFVNSQDGWLSVQPYNPTGQPTSSVVFGSTDGGAGWSVVDPSAPVGNISFQTSQVGWGTSPEGTELARTTDGGRTWQQVDLPSPTTGASTPGTWRTLTMPVISGGAASLLAVPATGDAVVETTTDGGSTWTVNATPFMAEPVYIPSGTTGQSPSCPGCVAPTEEPFAVVSHNVFIYWAGGEVFTTSDGGSTWATAQPNLSFPSLGTSVTIGAQPVVESADPLQFSSAGDGWAVATVDGHSLLLMTHDGGRHFQAVSPPTAPLPEPGSGA